MEKITFYVLKLPAMLVLICAGYLLDFVLQLPFLVMCVAAGSPKPRTAVRKRPSDRRRNRVKSRIESKGKL